MKQSYLILTDSGGIQEEGPAFGKPVLVLRETTERPEGIASGVAKLVGTSKSTIITEVENLLHVNNYRKMAKAKNPYGDGAAAKKIVTLIKKNI
jgi:UDP-N-acetylglucosamine 2-epimerase (non-hydrolysing)